MKNIGISLNAQDLRGSASEMMMLRELANKTPLLWELFEVLVAEDKWSRVYNVYVDFVSTLPVLVIDHPAFLPDRPLVIHVKAGMSVRDVEDAVRKHFHDSEESLAPEIKHLQERGRALSRASEHIMVDKAKAAIIDVFPETTVATLNSIGVQNDLYCFTGPDPGIKPVFAARNISNDFVGGVACINCNGGQWYEAEVGITTDQRNGIFWKALARTFAARELKIPKDSFYCQKVFSEEKPFLWPRPVGYDPYIVREVLFRQQFTDGQIVVTFGANNLPASVVRVPDNENVEV